MHCPFKPHVLLTSFYDRSIIGQTVDRLHSLADVLEVNRGRNLNEQELFESLPGMHASIAADEKYPAHLLDRAEDLVLIAREGTGYDGIDVAAATERGILVTNAPVVHQATANVAIGLLIGMVRKLYIGDRDVRENRWTDRDHRTCPALSDLTLGLLGFGLVGREVAKRAQALGIKALVYNRSGVSDAATWQVETGSMEQVLARSDVISIHIRHCPETTNLMGRSQFRKMKRGAYFINTARGGIVDEAALIEALQQGHLAGAALDVFAQEPPAPDNPLLGMDNVICTPHIGGETTTNMRVGMHMAIDQIESCLAGRRPETLVNPDAWEHARLHRLLSEIGEM
jgi:D-3-phosphoglycerate dehydrogenase